MSDYKEYLDQKSQDYYAFDLPSIVMPDNGNRWTQNMKSIGYKYH